MNVFWVQVLGSSKGASAVQQEREYSLFGLGSFVGNYGWHPSTIGLAKQAKLACARLCSWWGGIHSFLEVEVAKSSGLTNAQNIANILLIGVATAPIHWHSGMIAFSIRRQIQRAATVL